MTEMLNILTPSTSNIFFMTAVAGIGGFAVGFLIKSAAIARNKKRVISLEDEMLANHSRILDLEKQLAELREEKAKFSNASTVPKVELKVS
ncbi:hypothetical protein FRZ67_12600 [Panacibacter ginsenosidivorans]|uniref:LapA family protein n=1 Tax=Panacibacter ginsenosidivorans TaxID=1813871 RepID=A0A5B8V9A4_9BACT|nr:hypothetical protein [Panacibacter ginsenosidivorans]QEC68100.1 hypothetical protein FRZ67_12600 [Panacibacter ginsenosidivorans]